MRKLQGKLFIHNSSFIIVNTILSWQKKTQHVLHIVYFNGINVNVKRMKKVFFSPIYILEIVIDATIDIIR